MFPVGYPCIVCDRPCQSPLDFWETPDDGAMNAICRDCFEWIEASECQSLLIPLRRLLAAKAA